MTKDIAYQQEAMSICFEKFQAYAEPRQITLIAESYGFYEVRRANKKRILGAVKAVLADGTTGWVINWANRQRKFVADSDTRVVVGKKVSSDECCKSNSRKPRKVEPFRLKDAPFDDEINVDKDVNPDAI